MYMYLYQIYIYECACVYLPTSLRPRRVAQVQFLKRYFAGLNSEFSFLKTGCYVKVKEPCLPQD